LKILALALLLISSLVKAEVEENLYREIVESLEKGVWVTIAGHPVNQGFSMNRQDVVRISSFGEYYLVTGRKGICDESYTILKYRCDVKNGACAYFASSECIEP